MYLGPHRVRSGHGFAAASSVSLLREALRRRPQGQGLHLPGPVPRHGVCPVDLPRIAARHRGVSAGHAAQALPHGHPIDGVAQHAGQCQRGARLAHLRRLRAGDNRPGALAVRGRKLRRGVVAGDALRARRQHDRPVPVAVPLGALPQDQGRDQAAHAHGPARQHPRVYPCFRRENARREGPGLADSRGPGRSTSWTEATSTSPGCSRCIRLMRSS